FFSDGLGVISFSEWVSRPPTEFVEFYRYDDFCAVTEPKRGFARS
ncbi:hypothetical protein A2U01_0039503, partial [Trifolium medium]|nr:hypothetical protein [Trifolium medium]